MAPQSKTSSSRRKRVSLVPEWRRAYRMLSVQLVTGLAIAVEVWNSLPQEQQDLIVAELGVKPSTALLTGLAAVLVGRLVKQETVRD